MRRATLGREADPEKASATSAPACEDWCAGHTQVWSHKCNWVSASCTSCSQCLESAADSNDCGLQGIAAPIAGGTACCPVSCGYCRAVDSGCESRDDEPESWKRLCCAKTIEADAKRMSCADSAPPCIARSGASAKVESHSAIAKDSFSSRPLSSPNTLPSPRRRAPRQISCLFLPTISDGRALPRQWTRRCTRNPRVTTTALQTSTACSTRACDSATDTLPPPFALHRATAFSLEKRQHAYDCQWAGRTTHTTTRPAYRSCSRKSTPLRDSSLRRAAPPLRTASTTPAPTPHQTPNKTPDPAHTT